MNMLKLILLSNYMLGQVRAKYDSDAINTRQANYLTDITSSGLLDFFSNYFYYFSFCVKLF